ncbi:MAG: histidine phosphatase family protein [Nocardioides sp.]|jgi:broad specificity phosphatase PhoE|uniref:histidine phosphatase family protein n=1 Tax=Nocardioides sp. TaxID=35761 RepID=UPI00260573F9|nr:histidine phosphatase family protein [Nocardioides sp.]MCW2835463.1 histidine phosphatase family protein [Nocardioides sp.]
MRPRWKTGPVEIVLVRHGHSVGNLADAQAREQGAERLDLDARDADVELSETGQAQADAVKDWLAGADDDRGPTVVLSSPYRRAAETARRVVADCGLVPVLDERLRERDLGVFDGLTGLGIKARYPEEAERRQHLGKFYYQPPSGESWADVVLRVRSLLDDLRHGYDRERVWLFTHQAVISAFRYVLEDVSEQELLEIDRQTPIPNASFTRYSRAETDLVFELDQFADTTAVDRADVEVTREPRHDSTHAASGATQDAS